MTQASALPDNPAPRGRFFSVRSIPGWLDREKADALLAYAIDNEARFETAPVLHEGKPKIDSSLRKCDVLYELGPFQEHLAECALALKPELEKAFGIPAFDAKTVEIELAAHGDGAHFHRHIDTFVVCARARYRRILTLVLYLHRRPRGFTGGEVRTYALGGSEVMDITPEHNMLAAWPSFSAHSVERVSCPSGAFADRRFAINMFIQG